MLPLLLLQFRVAITQLTAFIVPIGVDMSKETDKDDLAKIQTSEWKSIFNDVYAQSSFSDNDPTLNKRVWVSSYTNEPFPEEEIFECINDTVSRIKSLQPSTVLEIGCGTIVYYFSALLHIYRFIVEQIFQNLPWTS